MKEILIVRHAKSSWSNPGLSDFERPLNNRGKNDAPLMAQFLSSKDIIPQLLISSPAKRAKTTAKVFKKKMKGEIDFELDSDLYHGDEADYLHAIRTAEERYNRIAVFGHNPTITYLANSVSSVYIDNVPTCGVLHIQSNIEEWTQFEFEKNTLINYYFPKLIF